MTEQYSGVLLTPPVPALRSASNLNKEKSTNSFCFQKDSEMEDPKCSFRAIKNVYKNNGDEDDDSKSSELTNPLKQVEVMEPIKPQEFNFENIRRTDSTTRKVRKNSVHSIRNTSQDKDPSPEHPRIISRVNLSARDRPLSTEYQHHSFGGHRNKAISESRNAKV